MNSIERHEARYQRRKAKREQKRIERANEYTEWDNVFGLSALIDGYKSSAKASRTRTPTQTWMANLVTNSRKIEKELAEEKWKSRGFNNFKIKERGKWRDIQSVHISEKGIQNSLCNNCLIPAIRPHLIYDNGASLKGKGTDFQLNRFTRHLEDHYRKYGREGGIFFYDFSSYFANILNAPLKDEVWKVILKERIFKAYSMFVDAFGKKGLGLGSQISQISAVFYANKIDHLFKDSLGIHGYGRYMDDGYVICHDINYLKELEKVFYEKCAELGIVPNKKKCRIIKLHRQFVFLKTRFFITENGKVVRRINRQSPRKERQRLKAFKKFYDMGLMDFKQIYLNFHSWLLSLDRWRSFHVKLNAIRYFNQLFGVRYHPMKIVTKKQKVLAYIARIA